MVTTLKALESFEKTEPLAVDLLSRAWSNTRITHAYIFSSQDSERALGFVKAFSKLLLCESRTATDNCRSCRVFDTGQHTDFRIWTPEVEKSKFIKLEQIHELVENTQVKPITSQHKVLVLDQAQQMRVEGSNALLKTLEEPSSFTTIILIVDNIDNLLATILSRCQIIPIKGVTLEVNNDFDFEAIIPKSFIEASELSNKFSALEKEQLTAFFSKLQTKIWENSKKNILNFNNMQTIVELIEKVDKYSKAIDSYVNVKLILDNFFIDLFKAKKFLEQIK